MIRSLLSLILFFITGSLIFGQEIVHGIILDETNSPLPGTTISDISNDSTVYADKDGRFLFTVDSVSPCIKVSFIGYYDTILCDFSRDFDTIIMLPKILPLSNIDMSNFDRQWADNTTVGVFCGILHYPYGISASDFTSFLFNLPIMTVTHLYYRTNFNNNHDLSVGVARYHGVSFNDFHFGLSYNYENIRIHEPDENMDFYCHQIYTTWIYKKAYCFVGYGYSELNKKSFNGIVSNLGFDIPVIHIGLLVGFDYWFDFIDYSAHVFKSIPKTNISLGAGYSHIDNTNEINIRIDYEIRH